MRRSGNHSPQSAGENTGGQGGEGRRDLTWHSEGLWEAEAGSHPTEASRTGFEAPTDRRGVRPGSSTQQPCVSVQVP